MCHKYTHIQTHQDACSILTTQIKGELDFEKTDFESAA